MLDRLQLVWPYIRSEVLRPTFRRFEADHPDLPIATVRTLVYPADRHYRFFVPASADGELARALADPASAIDSLADARRFLQIIDPEDFVGPQQIARFLADLEIELREYENEEVNAYLKEKITQLISRHRLPYRLRFDPVRFSPLLPAEVETLYLRLHARASANEVLAEAVRQFERTWADHISEWSHDAGRDAIGAAVNLAEAMARDAVNHRENTLGTAVGRMKRERKFPSNEFGSIIDKVYAFASDYPNMRHGGGPGVNVKRNLIKPDALLAACLMVSFAGSVHEMCE